MCALLERMVVMLVDAAQYDNFVCRYKKIPLSGL